MKNVRQGLRGRRGDDVFQRRQRDADGDDEEEARDAADGHAEADGVGDLGRDVSNLRVGRRFGRRRRDALTLTVASWHSSAMLEIIPIAEKQYATGKSPMKNVNPPQPAREVS